MGISLPINAAETILLKGILLNVHVCFNTILSSSKRSIGTARAKENSQKEYIYVPSNRKNIKIILNKVLYVESVKDYVTVHLIGSKLTIKSSISAFEKLLDDRFIRIHRSFLVNRDKVTAFTKNDIEIGEIEIPIGEYYKESALSKLK